MNIHKNTLIIGGIVGALIIGVGVWWFVNQNQPTPSENEETNNSSLEEELDSLGVGESIEDGGYTIERLPDAEAEQIPVPNLARPVPSSGGDVEGSARVQAVANMTALTADLGQNADNFNGWLLLGVYRTILGDYVGAEEAWVYVTLRYPNDWQAYANLGSLYTTHLKNSAKAEAVLTKAVAVQKDNAELYRALFNFYVSEENNTKATETLLQGTANAPKAIDLVILLARHYRDLGDATNARAQYDIAIALAKTSGNMSLVTTLETERAELE